MTTLPIQADDPRIAALLAEWHESGRSHWEARYSLPYDEQCPKRAVVRRKYILLDEGNSGAFVLDRGDGMIYRLKSQYGVPNLRKPIGALGTVSGNDLGKFRWF